MAWLVDHAVPPEYHQRAAARGTTLHSLLEAEAGKLRPGENGLLALDWLNGNRSVLADSDLQGMIVGLTLSTNAAEIYRALLEALAFGTRRIIRAFDENGLEIEDIVATGGLPAKNDLLMQVFADVTGRTIHLARSEQTSGLGSAIHAAVAAGPARGGFATVEEAVQRLVRPSQSRFAPNPQNIAVYDDLYANYVRLHDFFGRGDDSVMRQLRRIRTGT